VNTFYGEFWAGNLLIDKGTLLDTIKNQYTTFHGELQAFLSDLENCEKTNNNCEDNSISRISSGGVERVFIKENGIILVNETRSQLSRCCKTSSRRCPGFARSPSLGTAIRTCDGVRLKRVFQVPNLIQVRDFLLSILFHLSRLV